MNGVSSSLLSSGYLQEEVPKSSIGSKRMFSTKQGVSLGAINWEK